MTSYQFHSDSASQDEFARGRETMLRYVSCSNFIAHAQFL